MIKQLEHIGVAVENVDEALKLFEGTIGLKLGKVMEVESEKVKIAFLSTGNTTIELLEPTSEESAIASFLEKRGEGIHHICFEVEDIEEALEAMRKKGIKLIYDKPRVREDGAKISFLHPKSTHRVMIEFIEEPKA
ncbi:MAG: methylmalonyl-CoA epimerase [Candidatus Geothermarchaeales archaeon]